MILQDYFNKRNSPNKNFLNKHLHEACLAPKPAKAKKLESPGTVKPTKAKVLYAKPVNKLKVKVVRLGSGYLSEGGRGDLI